MTNPWIEHVRDYAKTHHMTYSEAMKQATTTYGGGTKKTAASIALKFKTIRDWLVAKIVKRVVNEFGDSTGGFGLAGSGGLMVGFLQRKVRAAVDRSMADVFPQYFPDNDERDYMITVLHNSVDRFIEEDLSFWDTVKGYKVRNNMTQYERTGRRTIDNSIRERLRTLMKKYIRAALDDSNVRQIIINNIDNFPIS